MRDIRLAPKDLDHGMVISIWYLICAMCETLYICVFRPRYSSRAVVYLRSLLALCPSIGPPQQRCQETAVWNFSSLFDGRQLLPWLTKLIPGTVGFSVELSILCPWPMHVFPWLTVSWHIWWRLCAEYGDVCGVAAERVHPRMPLLTCCHAADVRVGVEAYLLLSASLAINTAATLLLLLLLSFV